MKANMWLDVGLLGIPQLAAMVFPILKVVCKSCWRTLKEVFHSHNIGPEDRWVGTAKTRTHDSAGERRNLIRRASNRRYNSSEHQRRCCTVGPYGAATSQVGEGRKWGQVWMVGFYLNHVLTGAAGERVLYAQP